MGLTTSWTLTRTVDEFGPNSGAGAGPPPTKVQNFQTELDWLFSFDCLGLILSKSNNVSIHCWPLLLSIFTSIFLYFQFLVFFTFYVMIFFDGFVFRESYFLLFFGCFWSSFYLLLFAFGFVCLLRCSLLRQDGVIA